MLGQNEVKEGMKILFITSTRLGDAVLSTGILAELTRTYPHTEFTVACGDLPAPLFEDWPGATVFPLRRRFGIGHWVDLWRHSVGRRWDIIVDLRGTLLSYFLRAKKRFIWRGTKTRHLKARQFSELLRLPVIPYPSLYISDQRLRTAREFLSSFKGPFLAVAPAANWTGKEWPLSKMIELVQKIRAPEGLLPEAQVFVFAAPSEEEKLKPFFETLKDEGVHQCIGKFSFLEIYALMKSCDAFIGNDSGLMHLAAASGCPTLGLFGPSPDDLYAPFGPRTAFVRTPETYEELWERHKSGEEESRLMETLDVETVYQAFESLLKEKTSKCG